MNSKSFLLASWFVGLLSASAAPVNDGCLGAINLTSGVPFTMDTSTATTVGDPAPSCETTAGRGVWFVFVPPTSGAVTIGLCGSSFDTVLSVYTGLCDALVPLANGCVDDSAECGSQSVANFIGTAGTVYWILAAGYGGASGSLTVRAEVKAVKITQQPLGAVVDAGDTYTLSVQAVGSPAPIYQWRQNGVPIPGATRNWHTCANMAPAAVGNYTVVATSGSSSQTSDVAAVSMVPRLDLALNTPGVTWITGGGDGWYRQTDFWHDGDASAFCGASNGQSSPWMQTEFYGAAKVTFWWCFQRDAGKTDYISMSVNGQEQLRLASVSNVWNMETIYLGAGIQTCRWAYVQGAAPGGRPANIDQVFIYYGGTAAQIKTHPDSQTAVAGTNVTLRVEGSGTPPLSYSWLYKEQELRGATQNVLVVTNVQPRDAGQYVAIVSNAYGPPVVSVPASISITTLPVGKALDYPGLPFSPSQWFGQIGTTIDGRDAAQSVEITHNQQSALALTIIGPGTLGFSWKVSSEPNYDMLRFYLDDVPQFAISGEVGWNSRSFAIPSGTHSVVWAYEKDWSLSRGQDAAWLDQVTYSGSPYLFLEPGEGTVAVSWPGSLTGFTLQSSATVSGVWGADTQPSVLLDGQWVSTNSATAKSKRFFRLIK